MSILEVLQFPDPRLKIKAQPITTIDDELRTIVEDMFETMYHHHGLGLAGTQVNIHRQIFVMDISEERNTRVCVFNPEIIKREGNQFDYHGCLSVGAGISDKIVRAEKLLLRGMDLSGKTFEREYSGLGAICVQHEVDHLNGKLFIDHLSRLKISRIRKKIEKFNRRT